MFIAIARPAVEPKGPDAVAVPGSPAIAELSSGLAELSGRHQKLVKQVY